MLIALSLWAHADETPNTSRYDLFHPTPRELRRALDPGRPDLTQNPTTVDAGVVQIETGFFEYKRDSHRSTSTTIEAWSVLTDTTFRLGLLTDSELQITFTPYAHEQTKADDSGRSTTVSGFSDLDLRLRRNFWGNDGGRTALGADAFLTIPIGTALSGDKIEGGVAINFAWTFVEGLTLGMTGEPSLVSGDSGGEYDLQFVHTIQLVIEGESPVNGYVEYGGTAISSGGSDYEGRLSLGLRWFASENIALDVGTTFGLTRAAPDYTVTTGVTVRF